jgi:hypothetical protein
MSNSNELEEYIKESKLLIGKILKIEKILEAVDNIDVTQTGGSNKILKYKNEIYKLRAKKNEYLNRLEEYKMKIQNLVVENNMKNYQLQQFAMINWKNNEEKKNLVDKLEFLNKSLDLVSTSINRDTRNETSVLQKIQTQPSNRVSNVNITLGALDLEKADTFEFNDLEKQNGDNVERKIKTSFSNHNQETQQIQQDQYGQRTQQIQQGQGTQQNQQTQNQQNQQTQQNQQNQQTQQTQQTEPTLVGGNKLKMITGNIIEKLKFLQDEFIRNKEVVWKIVDTINDQNNKNSLYNIRIQFEWLVKKLKECSKTNKDVHDLIKQFEDLDGSLNDNLTNMSDQADMLRKILSDTSQFRREIANEKQQLDNDDIKEINSIIGKKEEDYIKDIKDNYKPMTGGGSKSLQLGGGLITIEQIGGNFDLERDTKFSTIENWMPFFTNITAWSQEGKYIFNNCRKYYYMIIQVSKSILSLIIKLFPNKASGGVDMDSNDNILKNLYEEYYEILSSLDFLNNIYDYKCDDIYKGLYSKYNTDSIKRKKIEEDYTKNLVYDLDKHILMILVENYTAAADANKLRDTAEKITRVANNISEFLCNYIYIKYVCESIDHKQTIYLTDIKKNDYERYELEMKKLVLQTNLRKKEDKYIELKSNIFEEYYKKTFMEPLNRILSIRSILDEDFIKDLEESKVNYENFILGLKYETSFMKPQVPFYNVDGLHIDNLINEIDKTKNIDFSLLISIRNCLYYKSDYNNRLNNLIDIISNTPIKFRIKKIDKTQITVNFVKYAEFYYKIHNDNYLFILKPTNFIENNVTMTHLKELYETVFDTSTSSSIIKDEYIITPSLLPTSTAITELDKKILDNLINVSTSALPEDKSKHGSIIIDTLENIIKLLVNVVKALIGVNTKTADQAFKDYYKDYFKNKNSTQNIIDVLLITYKEILTHLNTNYGKILLDEKEKIKLVEYEIDHQSVIAIHDLYDGATYTNFEIIPSFGELPNMYTRIDKLIEINNKLLDTTSVFDSTYTNLVGIMNKPVYTSDILINVMYRIANLAQQNYNDPAFAAIPATPSNANPAQIESTIKTIYTYLQARNNVKYGPTGTLALAYDKYTVASKDANEKYDIAITQFENIFTAIGGEVKNLISAKERDVNTNIENLLKGIKIYDYVEKIKPNVDTTSGSQFPLHSGQPNYYNLLKTQIGENKYINPTKIETFINTLSDIDLRIKELLNNDKKEYIDEWKMIDIICNYMSFDNSNKLLNNYESTIKSSIANYKIELDKIKKRFKDNIKEKGPIEDKIKKFNSQVISANNETDKNMYRKLRDEQMEKYSSIKEKLSDTIIEKTSVNNKLSKLLNLINLIEKKLEILKVINDNQEMILKVAEKIFITTKNSTFDLTNQNFITNRNTISTNVLSEASITTPDSELINEFKKLQDKWNNLVNGTFLLISNCRPSIRVYIKARHENMKRLTVDDMRYAPNCIYINQLKMNPKYLANNPGKTKDSTDMASYGKFYRVFGPETSLHNLYFAQGELTGGVRDLIAIGCKSTTIATGGVSGGGKSTALLGANTSDESNRKGVISNMLFDTISGMNIPLEGTDIKIEYSVYAAYGRKTYLSISNNDYTECFIKYKYNKENKIEEEYLTHSLDTETLKDDRTAKDPNKENRLEILDNTVKLLNENKTQKLDTNLISQYDKLNLWRIMENNSVDNFKLSDLPKLDLINLKGYTGDSTAINNYQEQFEFKNINNDPSSVNMIGYSILKDPKNFLSYTEKIKNTEEIMKSCEKCCSEINKFINDIQEVRKLRNHVRCTKNNPDSSRSHMFIIIRILPPNSTEYRYFNFIDMAGNEDPYAIAATELEKISQDLDTDERQQIFTVQFESNMSVVDDGRKDEEYKVELLEKLNTQLLSIKLVKDYLLTETSVKIEQAANTKNKIKIIFDKDNYLQVEIKIKKVNTIAKRSLQLGSNEALVPTEIDFIYKIDILINEKLEHIDILSTVPSIEQQDIHYFEDNFTIDKLSQNQATKDYINKIIMAFKRSIIKGKLETIIFSKPVIKIPDSTGMASLKTAETEANTELMKFIKNIITIQNNLDTDSLQLVKYGSSSGAEIIPGINIIANTGIYDLLNKFNDFYENNAMVNGILTTPNINITEDSVDASNKKKVVTFDVAQLSNIQPLLHFGLTNTLPAIATNLKNITNIIIETDDKIFAQTGGVKSAMQRMREAASGLVSGIGNALVQGARAVGNVVGNAFVSGLQYFGFMGRITIVSDKGTVYQNLLRLILLLDSIKEEAKNVQSKESIDLCDPLIENIKIYIKLHYSTPPSTPPTPPPEYSNLEFKATTDSVKESEIKKRLLFNILYNKSSLVQYIEKCFEYIKIIDIQTIIKKKIEDGIVLVTNEMDAQIGNFVGESAKYLASDAGAVTAADTEAKNNLINSIIKEQIRLIKKHIINKIFEETTQTFIKSDIDKSLPKTPSLFIDYRKMLSSFVINRLYFPQLKQGKTSCNSPEVIESIEKIAETLTFLFDNKTKNILTLSFVNNVHEYANMKLYTTLTTPYDKANYSPPINIIKINTELSGFISKIDKNKKSFELLNVFNDFFIKDGSYKINYKDLLENNISSFGFIRLAFDADNLYYSVALTKNDIKLYILTQIEKELSSSNQHDPTQKFEVSNPPNPSLTFIDNYLRTNTKFSNTLINPAIFTEIVNDITTLNYIQKVSETYIAQKITDYVPPSGSVPPFYPPFTQYINTPNLELEKFIKLLYAISQLDTIFSSLNFIKKKDKEIIIDFLNVNSILSSINKLLIQNYDPYTYMVEFDKTFNISTPLKLSQELIKYRKSSTSTNITEIQKIIRDYSVSFETWNDIVNYHVNWINISNKIIPVYLLNVLQGFWINHSIKYLMRFIMYSLDDFWYKSGYQLFDFMHNHSTTQENQVEDTSNRQRVIDTITAKDKEKGKTAESISKQIQYLNIDKILERITQLQDHGQPVFNNEEEVRKYILEKIAMNEMTFQENYLAEFEISKSSFLKTLISIKHLGSNNDPTVQQATSGTNKTEILAGYRTQITTNSLEEVTLSSTGQKVFILPFNVKDWTYEKVKRALEIDIGPTTTAYKISDTFGMIIATSTLPSKINLVAETLKFATEITKISNDECGPLIQEGGNKNYLIRNRNQEGDKKNQEGDKKNQEGGKKNTTTQYLVGNNNVSKIKKYTIGNNKKNKSNKIEIIE